MFYFNCLVIGGVSSRLAWPITPSRLRLISWVCQKETFCTLYANPVSSQSQVWVSVFIHLYGNLSETPSSIILLSSSSTWTWSLSVILLYCNMTWRGRARKVSVLISSLSRQSMVSNSQGLISFGCQMVPSEPNGKNLTLSTDAVELTWEIGIQGILAQVDFLHEE